MVNSIKYVVSCHSIEKFNFYINLLKNTGDYTYQVIEKNKSYKIIQDYSHTTRKQIFEGISNRANQLNIIDENLINKVTDEIYCAEIAESIVQKGELLLLFFSKSNQGNPVIKITLLINLYQISNQTIIDCIDYYANNQINMLKELLDLNASDYKKSII